MAKRKKTVLDDPNMKLFEYIAVSAVGGDRVKARMAAPRASIVATTLQSEGYVPVSVIEVENTGLNFDIGAKFKRPFKLKVPALAAFSRQLHQLLKAGLSIPKSLQALGTDHPDPRMTQMTTVLADKTSSGIPLSVALKDYPKVFDDIFISYIAAGEETGELVATTGRLAKIMEKKAKLQGKIKSVTAYPKMVSSAVGLIVVGIIAFLVPKFEEIYASFGAELPGPTKALVSISNQMNPVSFKSLLPSPLTFIGIPYPNPTSPIFWILGIFFGVRFYIRANRENLDFREKLDKFRYKIPIFGKLTAKLEMYRWASTLSGALQAGMQLMPALELAGRSTGSGWHMKVAASLREVVRTGKSLTQGLEANRALFPSTVRSMVATGEVAGELPNMLESVAEAIDDEVDTIVSTLGSRLEVALLMVMGIVVGGLLMVLYLPIINLASAASSGNLGG